jgi:hypothetical protein
MCSWSWQCHESPELFDFGNGCCDFGPVVRLWWIIK